ncbi:MAG: poly-beta-hydroxybutyrate polymerase, partial [Hyphomicrobiaceae bacterium]|nr:poly-beta-hydroxybutyrate polymerase [Hyphomicrobiaceae bacterium]
LLLDTDVTFLLTSGGHNAGIVSEPGRPGRNYRVHTKAELGPYADPDTWLKQTAVQDGSWWPEWCNWLAAHSGSMGSPVAAGADIKGERTLDDAPGTYVLQP